LALYLIVLSVIFTIISFWLKERFMINASAFLLILIMFLLISFCYSWADFYIYLNEFYNSALYGWNIFDEDFTIKEVRQFGFLYLNKLCLELGFSFSEMRFISSGLLFILTICLIRRITEAWQYVVVLYAVYPFVLDLIQTRNFFLEFFITLAIYVFAREENGIKRILKYMCVMIVGASFHTMALIYFPVLLVNMFKKLKYALFIIALISPVFVHFIINNGTEILMNIGVDDSPLQAYLMYTEGTTSDASVADPYMRFLRLWMMVVCFWSFIWYIDKNVVICEEKDEINDTLQMNTWKIRFIKTTKMMWKYALWLLPILAITPSMERIPRNLLLSFFISFAIYIELCNPKNKLMLTLLIMTVLVLYAGYYNDEGIKFLHINTDKNYIFE